VFTTSQTNVKVTPYIYIDISQDFKSSAEFRDLQSSNFNNYFTKIGDGLIVNALTSSQPDGDYPGGREYGSALAHIAPDLSEAHQVTVTPGRPHANIAHGSPYSDLSPDGTYTTLIANVSVCILFIVDIEDTNLFNDISVRIGGLRFLKDERIENINWW
jgi:hypothetical protein